MATYFDRWEKDPFFSAAEEVQESADRMESTYRTWLHSKKDSSSTLWNSDEVRRDLQTSLGTTKWQLEEFERAVNSSYQRTSANDSKDRHRDFIIAISNQVSKVQKSLNESVTGKPPLRWVRLDEGESDELALFLSGPTTTSSSSVDKNFGMVNNRDHNQQAVNSSEVDSSHSHDDEKLLGMRRAASAAADIGSWNILVSDSQSLLNGQTDPPPPRKTPSFGGFLNKLESVKWSKDGYRKWKPSDLNLEAVVLPRSTNGFDVSYTRSKSHNSYDKQIYGWYGTIQRQLQRSQYYMQYSRPFQVIFLLILLFCIIVLVALRVV